VLRPGQPGHDSTLRRLWQCWAYHWRDSLGEDGQGVQDGWAVAARVRAGLGAHGLGNLGGDPFRDVVLADAVLRKDNTATALFERDYRDFLTNFAARLRADFATTYPDWWSELMDRLAGYTRTPGKLEKYSGRCGLRHWLSTVTRRFVYDCCRSFSTDKPFEPVGRVPDRVTPPPDYDLITLECLQQFQDRIQSALGRMTAEARLLLGLCYVDGLNDRQAARVLNIHPANVGRRKERALAALAEGLDVPASGEPPRQDYLFHLLHESQRRTFGALLLEALGATAQPGGEA
jgi:RNA polymerase sigma factor (sigma-70 family)